MHDVAGIVLHCDLLHDFRNEPLDVFWNVSHLGTESRLSRCYAETGSGRGTARFALVNFISSLTDANWSSFHTASTSFRRAGFDMIGPASAWNFSSTSLSVSGFR